MRKFIAVILFILLSFAAVALDGDANADHVVDLKDLILVAQNFGLTSGFDARADINTDNAVNLLDLIAVARNYGKSESVPECGDGNLDSGEGCDDANPNSGDGCSNCQIESGWTCSDEPSFCIKQSGDTVEQWKRFEVSYNNPTWSGNPFDLDLTATFTHQSGRKLTQLGFYAGNNVWKIFFMPDTVGDWTFTTSSSDPDLNYKQGSFTAVQSNLPGLLKAQGNMWQFSNGKYVTPILIPTSQWFKRTPTQNGIADFIDWADQVVGARVIGTTLVYFGYAHDEVPYIKGKEGDEFNIPMWDRLNDHYDYLRDRGMGHYIMFYSDDEESPNRFGISEKSQEEIRLFKYAVARFSPYPIVIWDTGIDIGETRSNSWIDWFANWFNQNDPWQHPVDSRSGGGSGGKHASSGTYWSDGEDTLPSRSSLINKWQSRSVPTIFTDRWREDDSRGNFDKDRIREAVWMTALSGGMGVYVSGNENWGYLTHTYATDFKAAPFVGYASKFFHNIGYLVPKDDLISGNAILAADVGEEYVAYLKTGGSVTVQLSSGTYTAKWYNPRIGAYTNIGSVSGSQSYTAPDTNDWVLYIYR